MKKANYMTAKTLLLSSFPNIPVEIATRGSVSECKGFHEAFAF
jgi:hypothetical protein